MDVRRPELTGIGRKESSRQHTHTPDWFWRKGQKCNWKQLKLMAAVFHTFPVRVKSHSGYALGSCGRS